MRQSQWSKGIKCCFVLKEMSYVRNEQVCSCIQEWLLTVLCIYFLHYWLKPYRNWPLVLNTKRIVSLTLNQNTIQLVHFVTNNYRNLQMLLIAEDRVINFETVLWLYQTYLVYEFTNIRIISHFYEQLLCLAHPDEKRAGRVWMYIWCINKFTS